MVLAPPVLAAAWYGAPYFDMIVLAGSAILAWEWSRICRQERFGVLGVTLALDAVLAIGLAVATGSWSLGLAAGAAAAAATALTAYKHDRPALPWMVLGAAYIVPTCLALAMLRGDAEHGRLTLLWLFAVVWATDIGAYAAGRAIGGPKLAPSVSPNKTWAGLLGGMTAAAAVGWSTSDITGLGHPGAVAASSAALGAVAQVGDLFESGIKRHFGVKDASRLIPGHGGLFDRVDGLLAAALAVWLWSLPTGGGLPLWR